MNRRGILIGASTATLFPAMSLAGEGSLPQPAPELWNPLATQARQGWAQGPNGKIAYWSYGDASAVPVIVLHGGPAIGHTYMRPYAALAHERRVILYDQSGCGQSDAPADLSRYTVARYVAELEALRAQLDFQQVILVGHSWGGMLAIAYAQAHGTRVAGLVLAGTAPVLSDFVEAAETWLSLLGKDAAKTVHRAEASGRTDDPAYQRLLTTYYQRHLCRLDSWPAWLPAELEAAGKNPVYTYLNGPSEFQFSGALRTMDLRPGLASITAPSLVTCGEYDEAPRPVAQRLAKAIPGARVHVFPGLSHLSHIEAPSLVVGTSRRFIASLA